jgi:hypothetical protein
MIDDPLNRLLEVTEEYKRLELPAQMFSYVLTSVVGGT